jgi:alpha-beta hydrolase superfamily lysophospholipase
VSTTGRILARDGTPLRVREWSTAAEPWAAMLLVHGLGEHSGRYEDLGARLSREAVLVRAFDQRGFGASGGRRAYVDRWAEYGDDVADRLADLRSAAPNLPLALYGHSLGGLIVLDALVRGVVQPDLVVLSAPAVDSTIPAWRRVGARAFGRLVPKLSVRNGLPGAGLARDPAVAAEAAADPLNLSRSTVGLGAESFAAQRSLARTLASLDHLPAPTYVLHGSEDPIVPAAATARLERFPEVTRVVHPGLRHESHHEPEADAVMDAMVSWLRAAIEGVRSGQLKIASGERMRAESVVRPQTRGT